MSTIATYRSNAVSQNEPRAEAAFLKLRPKYVALPSAQVMTLNLDVTPAIATLTAASSRSLELRPALAQLYEYNLAAVDELPDAILGLEYTHAEVMIRMHPSDDLEDLNREAIQTRDRFLHDQANLAKGGVIDPCLLGQFTGTTGYKAVVTDIRTSVAVYRAIGAAAEGKSCCSPEDIARAELVIRAMERRIGERNLGGKSAREWIDMRARAFTLAINDYAEVRRGVNYLRWYHEDADSYAPSLYKGRIKKRRTSKTAPEKSEPEQPAETNPATPRPVIGANGPFMPADAATVACAQPRIPGMPGGSPFIQ